MQRNCQLTHLMVRLITTSFLMVAAGSSPAQVGGNMPPPAVAVIELVGRDVPVVNELPGRLAATRIADVRARVSGILQERVFEQGAFVNKDDVLYQIDPRLFRVRVASAEATLQRARSTRENARLQLERQKSLRKSNVASGVDYDTAAVNLAQADADVASAEAGLEEARINLDYTKVRAPISGIIGGALVTEGALVIVDGTSNLALIQQVDPVYADFTQPAHELLNLRRAVAEGKLASSAPGEARVELVFDDGSLYAAPGRLLFASANVDPNTGQVTLRAEFPNKNGDLLPGMYVRVRIEQAVRQNAFTVPQRAVVRDDNGQAQVYVLGNDNSAQIRKITLGQASGSEWVVESGLNAGEIVIVDGVQKIRPGLKVKPEPWRSIDGRNDPSQNPSEASE